MNIQSAEDLLKEIGSLKTGWKTSEFWVTLTPAVVVLLHVLGVHIGSNETTTLITICWGAVSVVYLAVRTWLKAVHVKSVTSVATVLHNLEREAKAVFQQASAV